MRVGISGYRSGYYEELEQSIVDYARSCNWTYAQAEERMLGLSPLTRRGMHEHFRQKHGHAEPCGCSHCQAWRRR